MKKCICYYKESDQAGMSSVHIENAESSMCLFITDDQKHLIKLVDDQEEQDVITAINSLPVITEELIMLKKAGFTAAEIIELKQSKLI